MSIPLPKAIGRPATRALATIGVTTLEHLTKHTRKELLAFHGFGPKAARILEEELEKLGLSFRDE